MASDNKTMSPGMAETQNAVEFINKTVLKPDVTPINGTAKPMVDQAVGMMVQDLQSFLKGFEQIGLVAMGRLANNILTYGTYFGPKTSGDQADNSARKPTDLAATKIDKIGADAFGDLFKVMGDYGKAKAEITSLMSNLNSSAPNPGLSHHTASPIQQQPTPEVNTQQFTPQPTAQPSIPKTETAKNKSWFSKKHK